MTIWGYNFEVMLLIDTKGLENMKVDKKEQK